MKQDLSKLVEGCVEAHVTAAATRDARNQFRALITHAYELGVKDGKEEEVQARNKVGSDKKTSPQSQGQNKGQGSEGLQNHQSSGSGKEDAQGAQGVLKHDAASALAKL